MGGADLDNRSHVLRRVLLSLSQTATVQMSLRLGRAIIHSMDSVTRLHHATVEQAAFVVLKSPDIPSLLIETGFISNPAEAARLRSARYQERLALSISRGVTRYFSQQLHSKFF